MMHGYQSLPNGRASTRSPLFGSCAGAEGRMIVAATKRINRTPNFLISNSSYPRTKTSQRGPRSEIATWRACFRGDSYSVFAVASKATTQEWQCTENVAHVPLNSPSCERAQLVLMVFLIVFKEWRSPLCRRRNENCARCSRTFAHCWLVCYPAVTALKASRAAAMVAATSSAPCAVLKKAASNCEGGSQTPPSLP